MCIIERMWFTWTVVLVVLPHGFHAVCAPSDFLLRATILQKKATNCSHVSNYFGTVEQCKIETCRLGLNTFNYRPTHHECYIKRCVDGDIKLTVANYAGARDVYSIFPPCTVIPIARVKRVSDGVSSNCQHLEGIIVDTVEECRQAMCAKWGNTFDLNFNIEPNCVTKRCTGGGIGYSSSNRGFDVYTTLPCYNENGECDHNCSDSGIMKSCSCRSGFALQSDRKSCQDNDECANSPCQHTCTNTPGSYACSCRTGYELSTNQFDCTDNDECANSPCDHTCTNTPGSYACSCRSGYELSTNQFDCTDNDECANSPCHHTCTNTPGSYACSCRTGYELNTNQGHCTDIDECDANQPPCEQQCENTPGGYICKCRAGYRLEGRTRCTNVDECTDGQHDCSQTCTDNVGSYTCSCRDGSLGSQVNKQCHDIDECASHPCSHNCINTLGSYSCSCRAGYDMAADGLQCHDSCTRQFTRSVSRLSGVSSDCPTLKVLENVTWDRSMHVACEISSNVVNVLNNVHVLKRCPTGELRLTDERSGWDVYNRFGQTVSEFESASLSTGTIVGVTVAAVVVVIAAIVIIVLLKRRSSRTRGPPQEHTEQGMGQSGGQLTVLPPIIGGTAKPEQAKVDFNPNEVVYEEIDQQRGSTASVKDNPGQTYYNIKPAKEIENYDNLNKDEIHPPMTHEYEKVHI